MTPNQLSACTGSTLKRAEEWLPHIQAAFDEFLIVTPLQQAAFLAQAGHETGGLKWIREIWGPTKAQMGYEGRLDLGNTEPGDGHKFMGRGLFQVTGRFNYMAVSKCLKVDLIHNPELLEEPHMAARSAGLYWKDKKLNQLASAGKFREITKKINGGLNGYDNRLKLYNAAKLALNA